MAAVTPADVANPSTPWRNPSAIAVVAGITVVTVVMGLEAGILQYLVPLVAVVVLSLVAILSRQSRKIEQTASRTGVFEAYTSACGPQSPDGPLRLAKVGMSRGPVGKLRVDENGISWTPRGRRKSQADGLAVDWSQVDQAETERMPGLNDPTFLALQLRSGERWSFATSVGHALRATLDRYLREEGRHEA
jgi:hypothetical protein